MRGELSRERITERGADGSDVMQKATARPGNILTQMITKKTATLIRHSFACGRIDHGTSAAAVKCGLRRVVAADLLQSVRLGTRE